MLSAFSRQLTPEAAAKPPLPALVLTDQLGALLALATGQQIQSDDPATADRRTPNQRVLAVIRERYAEPHLTAAMVAASVTLSERSVHRCLARRSTTFAGELTRVRMQTARRMLADARFDTLTVGEIGRRVGFSDASHFVRLCRRHLGATPGLIRRSR